MPKYQIKSPDGRTFIVNAPEGATPEQAQAFAQRQFATPGPQAAKLRGAPTATQRPKLPKAPPAAPLNQNINRFSDSIVNGALPGLGEFGDGVDGVIGNAYQALRGRETFDPSAAFTKARRASIKGSAQYAKEHPRLNAAGNAAGFVGSFSVPGLNVAKGARVLNAATGIVERAPSLLTHAINGSATAAAYGTAAGALKGEGSDRLVHAAEGGIGGAFLGAAAAPVVKVGASVIGGVVRVAAPYFAPSAARGIVQANAERSIGDALAPQFTPATAAAEVARRNADNIPASLSDLTDGTRQLTGHASRGLGPGQSAVRSAIAARQDNSSSRVQSHIAESLGPTVDPHFQTQQLTDRARAAAAPLYDEAYQAPVTVTPALREFLDSGQGRSAINAGISDIANTPSSRRNIGSETPTRPGVTYDPELSAYRSGDVPVMEAFDGAKRHLDNIIQDGDSRFIPKTGASTTNTRPAQLQQEELLRELDAQVPAYAEARAAYAGPAADRSAFLTGRQELPGSVRRTVPDAVAQQRRMTPSQLEQMRLGDRTRLADEVGARPKNADATAPLTGNSTRTALIRQVHGDDAAERLQSLVDAELQSHLTYKEVFANSQTSNRNVVDADMGAGGVMNAVGQVASRGWMNAAIHLLSDAKAGRVGRYGHQLKEELARMLTDNKVETVEHATSLIQRRIETDAAFRDRLGRVASQLGKVGTTQLIGNSGDETGIYPDQ